ncbi:MULTISPECIES: MFS transporter [unclassified Rubrivivax]|uniref:MFS transporter n=1 Tax=unclassified Rubrivivax TaxID=2649762 RepID=UPI001E4E6397|nr:MULTISPECIES: MFS transporter [unclassified Rubrivivax]MCC9597966.1 MFS transporter [Rubrivivax sp. JA1055]MCC9645777.1 MFS transporter [Rubrivivax sp. JA1029]
MTPSSSGGADPLHDRNLLADPDVAGRWRLRFWVVFGGQSLSLIGSVLTQFVLLWWITDTTGSVSALATAGLAALLPQALLAPLGGTVADRYSRRFVMVAADLVSALCMVVLIVLFTMARVDLVHVYALMAIRSAMQAFQAPAAAASVPMLVPRAMISRVSGVNQAVQGLTVVAAAPLGALALGVMPIGWALTIDVVTAVLGVAPLLYFAIPQPRREVDASASLVGSMWMDFREGAAFVWSSPGWRRIFALLTGVMLVVMPSYTLVPLLVKSHFGGGAQEVALIEGLAGLGMLLGGALVAVMAPRRHVLWVVLGFGASCLSLALTAIVPPGLFWIAVIWWTLSGVTYVFGNAPLTSLLQTGVPVHLQGRVFSLLQAIVGFAAPVGLAVVAPLGQVTEVDTLFVAMGLLGAGVSFSGLLSPRLLGLGVQERES